MRRGMSRRKSLSIRTYRYWADARDRDRQRQIDNNRPARAGPLSSRRTGAKRVPPFTTPEFRDASRLGNSDIAEVPTLLAHHVLQNESSAVF